jgi:predicted O-methyltransferase YrrM
VSSGSVLRALAAAPRVAWFQLRARRLATQLEDHFTLYAALHPRAVGALVWYARDARTIVEIGTGSGLTAISLALAHPGRRVITYDKGVHPLRDFYFRLVPASASRRISVVHRFVECGPVEEVEIDLLFIDSSHRREETLSTFRLWEPHVRCGAFVVFDDYRNRVFPGVTEAIAELQLVGTTRYGRFFVWQKPSSTSV